MKWDENSIPDLTGRVALVTGGNTGLGLETVKHLALHGATVYIGARSEPRAKQAIAGLLSAHKAIPKARLIWLPLDLSKPTEVVEAAQLLRSKETRLDLLVNNAGFAAEKFVTTAEGFELTMAVNHVGHFLLTTKLLPLLKTTAAQPGSDVRVVTISSVAEKLFAPTNNTFATAKDLNDSCTTGSNRDGGVMGTFKRYGISKVANILFTKELQRRLDGEGINIASLAVHPGAVATEGGVGIWPFFLRPIMRVMMVKPAKGVLAQLFCSTGTDVLRQREKYKGQYVSAPGVIGQPSERSRDKQLAQSLWRITEEALAAAGIDVYQ